MIAIALCFVFPIVGALMLVAGLVFNLAVNLYDYWYNNCKRVPQPELRYR